MKIKDLAMYSVVSMTLLLTTIGCDINSPAKRELQHEADSLLNVAYEAKNYEQILTLVDSLKETGALSEGKAFYWLGYASDRTHKKRMAELYWTQGMTVMDDAKTPEDLEVYAAIASRLTGLKCTWGEYEAGLKVAIPALEHLKKYDAKMTSDYINLLIYQGCCQSRFGLSEEATNKSLEEAYQAHLDNMEKNPNAIAYRDAFVGVINICYNFLEIHDYQKAIYWIDRYGKLLDAYGNLSDARPDYADKQWARYYVYRATALEGVGRKVEAAEMYQKFLRTTYSLTAEGLILGSDYLRQAGLWDDAADNLSSTERLIKEYGVDYSLQTIQEWMLKKYYVNIMAHRIDTARTVSMQIVQHLDSAITKQRRQDAIEEEAVRQKETEMTAEKERMERQQWWTRLAAMAVLILALIIYIIVRNHMSAKLKKAHGQLKVAYDQLEETTAAKERIESDLRIASGIQMGMLPTKFPTKEERNDVQLYASLTPAKEVGGDLFDFYFRDEKLFFCIGDVSGKGVPASLFMAVTRAVFRTVSAHESMPDSIVTTMNKTIADMNRNHMFVTLFVGVLDLPTGRLHYCNAGHDAPLLVGAGVGELPCDANIPVGFRPKWKYSLQEAQIFTGTTIFLFTDGLTEAMDVAKDQFTMERVNDVAAKALSQGQQEPKQLIGQMTDAVHQFVGDAEQSDDLTMMAIQYIREQSDVLMRKNIVLANDTKEVPKLHALVDEVCEAVEFDEKTSMQMRIAIEEAVVNVMDYAYPPGQRGEVTIEATSTEGCLKFTIIDSGKPFDPTVQAAVDTSLPARERRIGGLGIHIVRQMMDSINYERMDNLNVLTLKKIIK